MSDLRTGAIKVVVAKMPHGSLDMKRIDQVATELVDAVLDYLEAHADEWTLAAADQGSYTIEARRYIGVLRSEDTGGVT